MPNETPFTLDQVRAWLNSTYGFTADALALHEVGGRVRYTFNVANKPHLLTLANTAPGADWLKLMQALYYDHNITQMPKPPIRARSSGDHVNAFEGRWGYVQEHPRGHSASAVPLTENQHKQLGSLFATLHRARLEKNPPAETFGADVVALIALVNKRLDDAPTALTHDQMTVRAWLNDARTRLNDVFAPFVSLHHRLSTDADLRKRFVLCHANPTPAHVVMNDQERMLNLLYWDAPRYAPAECDLVHWEDVPQVLEGYQRMIATFTPHADVSAYYRTLADVRHVATLAHTLLFTPLPASAFEADFGALKARLAPSKPAEADKTELIDTVQLAEATETTLKPVATLALQETEALPAINTPDDGIETLPLTDLPKTSAPASPDDDTPPSGTPPQ
jgi:hypothetical protein